MLQAHTGGRRPFFLMHSAAMNEIGAADRQEVGLGSQSRREFASAVWRRGRAMQRFRSLKTLLKFSSVHAQVYNQFNQ